MSETEPVATPVAGRRYGEIDIVPIADWSKDHWTTLAYAETVMVDCGGFQVGTDPRMRANRAHFRVLREGCPSPKRAKTLSPSMALSMEPRHTSRLSNGATAENHDDWCCLQDMAAHGLLGPAGFEPGDVLHLTGLGDALATELRRHKASGGNYAAFRPSREILAEAEAAFSATTPGEGAP